MTISAASAHPQHERRATAWLLFLGLWACYFVLHPGSIGGQGYTGEEIASGVRMLQVLNAWLHGTAAPAMIWSRHGPLPVLFDLPFLQLGKAFVNVEFGLSMQPMLLTAATLAVLYLWLRAVASPAVSLILTGLAAFGTMFWPYAYIGLETKQTFAVVLAGYLALAGPPIRSWPRTIAFGAVCALAISLKSTGALLGPAILYLVYVQFRRDWRAQAIKIGAILAVMAGVFLAASWGRNLYWAPLGGGFASLRGFMVSSAVELLTNAVGIFGSPTKGLFVYAPVLLAAIWAVPAAYRRQRETTVFAVLVTAATCAFLCLLRYPADEVWGSRYLHVVIAPLIATIGAAWPAFDWRKHLPIAAIGVVGVPVAFLGAFFYYGNLVSTSSAAAQNTMEGMTEDHVWNPIAMDARLFGIWRTNHGEPVFWTPGHLWVWAPPGGVDDTKRPINLRPYAQPQSFLVRFWNAPPDGGKALVIFRLAEGALIAGPLLLLWAAVRTARLSRRGQDRIASAEAGRG